MASIHAKHVLIPHKVIRKRVRLKLSPRYLYTSHITPSQLPTQPPTMQSSQMLIEPSDRLQERLLLREPLDLLARIAAHAEAVTDAAVQVDLVRLLRREQDLLGPVALLRWEDLVCFRGGDGERAGDGGQLGFLDEGGVRDVPDVDAFAGGEEANGVFSSLCP